MTEPTFCDAINSNEIQKYRNLTALNDKFDIDNTSRTANCAQSSMWPSSANQFAGKQIKKHPENNNKSEILFDTTDEDMTDECCPLTTSLATSDNCSLPLSRWTKLSQITGTRPAVDKHTISRYSPGEWKLRNDKLSNDANKAIRDAKNIIFAERMLDGQVYLPVDINQAENNNRIQDRAQIIYHWKRELEKKNYEITDEIEKIQQLTQQLLRCNRTVEFIINIDHDIQRVRCMRLPPDLVHDSLTDEIIKEEALCAEVINLNTRYIDEVKKQIRELKDAKRRLEHDWSDKKIAYDIDSACLNIKSSSPTIQWKPGCAHLPDGQSTPASHEYFVKETIIFIRAALGRSRVLRENVKDVIRNSAKDLRAQANLIDIALIKSINVTFQGCKKLERSLDKCLKSLANTETTFDRINGAVRKLDAPMKCAQTKLDMRLKRENIENCRDIPQFTLIDEVKTISENVSALLSQTKGAEESIETLSKSRQQIEKEIAIKEKTLWVDNERCRLFRSFYPIDQALLGYE